MSIFLQTICTISFGWACWAGGDILLRFFLRGKPLLSPIARHALAFATGNVLFSYVITGIGFAGLLIPFALKTVFLAGVGLAIWRTISEFRNSTWRTLRKRETHGWRGKRRLVEIATAETNADTAVSSSLEIGIRKNTKEDSLLLVSLICIVGICLLPAALQAAAPPYIRDSLVYHLLCPKGYLDAGRIIHIEGNIFSAFPKGHEVLMTLLLGIAGDRAAQGFSILQQTAAIAGLYSLIRLTSGTWPSVLCTLGYATIPPAMYFAGCGYADPAFMMAYMGALLALFTVFKPAVRTDPQHDIKLGQIGLVAFLTGWIASIKYTGLIYVALVTLMLFWSLRKMHLKTALRTMGVFALGVLPGFCWMIWNWMALRNPVYPLAWVLFGGGEWDAVRAITLSRYLDGFGMGRSLSDYLLLPYRLAFSGQFDTTRFDGAVGPFLLIFLLFSIPSIILWMRGRLAGHMMKEIGFMFAVSSVFFVFGSQQSRVWLPSQFLLCAFAAPGVELLVVSVKRKRLMKMALLAMMIASIGWNIWFVGRKCFSAEYYKPVLGMERETDFLRRTVPGYAAMEFINLHLPENAYVLCIWTGAYGYYLNRRYYSDTFLEDVLFKKFVDASGNGEELSEKLHGAGFTHLFLRSSLVLTTLKPEQQSIFIDFIGRRARKLFNDVDFFVFDISAENRMEVFQ